MYTRKRSRNNRNKTSSIIKITAEILAVFLLIIGIFFSLNHSKGFFNIATAEGDAKGAGSQEEQGIIFDYKEYPREAGSLQVVENIEGLAAYGIQYPVFGQDSLDQDIWKKVEEFKETFLLEATASDASSTDENPIYTVSYENYVVGDQIVSIIFHVSKNDRKEQLFTEIVRPYLYNLQTGESVVQQDIFLPGFEHQLSAAAIRQFESVEAMSPYISTALFKSNTSPLPGNYNVFAVKGDDLVFYFSGGMLAPQDLGPFDITIPRAELEDVLRIDGSGHIKETEAPPETLPDETPPETQPPTEPSPPASPETEPTFTLEPKVPSVELDLNRPMVAFTFDDGPYTPVTGRILDVLEANHSKATFFVVGNRVNNYKDTLRRIYEMGCQIGNHSYSHKNFANLSEEDIQWQITYTNDLIEDIIGTRTELVRIPYGAYKGHVSAAVKYPMMQWNIDPLDWQTKDKDNIIEEVMKYISDGDVILMHDLYPSTAEAMEELVPRLIAEGYQLVTLNDLYAAKKIPLEPGSVYFNTN